MPELTIRPLDRDDLAVVSKIFTHYVLNTTYSFHISEVGPEVMASKLGFDREVQTSFGLFDSGELLGYSLLNPWKAPEAYKATAEISIYLHPDRTASGHGLRLLEYTEREASARGISMLIAGICTENERSTRFFERAGYEKCAHFRSIGRKFGRELDVIYLQKRIE